MVLYCIFWHFHLQWKTLVIKQDIWDFGFTMVDFKQLWKSIVLYQNYSKLYSMNIGIRQNIHI